METATANLLRDDSAVAANTSPGMNHVSVMSGLVSCFVEIHPRSFCYIHLLIGITAQALCDILYVHASYVTKFFNQHASHDRSNQQFTRCNRAVKQTSDCMKECTRCSLFLWNEHSGTKPHGVIAATLYYTRYGAATVPIVLQDSYIARLLFVAARQPPCVWTAHYTVFCVQSTARVNTPICTR